MNQRRPYLNRKFGDRYKTMGDVAEDKFSYWCATHAHTQIRFGFDRPNLVAFWWLPKLLRYTPDFILELPDPESYSKYKHYFVEAKGCGKDGLIKIKEDNLWALGQWSKTLKTFIFGYDSINDEYRFAAIEDILQKQYTFGRRVFEDNKKPYICVPIRDAVWKLNIY